MPKLTALIVDDSIFSVTILRALLEKKGLEVVGQAAYIEEAVEKAKRLQPDLITMDMTLSDGTGLSCSRQILDQCPGAKIIAISSMKDREILRMSKEAGIVDYIQKPIDPEELFAKIDRIFLAEQAFENLQNYLATAFAEALSSNLRRLEDHPITVHEGQRISSCAYKSRGIAVAVGIIGLHSGRLILDTSWPVALHLAQRGFERVHVEEGEVFSFMAEFTQVIAGNAASLLNSIEGSLMLRISPPALFQSEDLTVSLGALDAKEFSLKTSQGDLFATVAFCKGEQKWI